MIVQVSGTLIIEKDDKKPVAMACDDETVNTVLQSNADKDFTIVVGEKSVKVHKRLLLDASPYFIGMFNSGMIEATQMKATITDFDYEIVEAGIQLLYNPSKIPTQFTFEQMLEILRFSDKYDITVIKNLMQDLFIANLSPTNVSPLINCTNTTVSAPTLYNKCIKYFVKCSEEKEAVHGLETLDKDILAKIFSQFFVQTL